MARKNGNEFERLIDAVNQTRAEAKKSRIVHEKTLEIQRNMLDEMRETRTVIVASVERVLENFVETKVVSKADHAALERRVELLEKNLLPED
jgi:hypothetical protein